MPNPLYQTLDELKTELLKNPEIKEEFEKSDVAFDIATMISQARGSKGWTQATLAKKIGTYQSSIARIESGENLPSLRFLQKILDALEIRLIITFEDIAKVNGGQQKVSRKSLTKTSKANY